jgi:hypothetical protein
VDLSIERQVQRGDPYTYSEDQLETERSEYLRYGKKHGFPTLNGQRPLDENLERIRKEIGEVLFPSGS